MCPFEVYAWPGGGGHKVPRSVCGPLMSMYMVKLPILQHESMNICSSSNMKGKLVFIGHLPAIGNDFAKKIPNLEIS